MSNEWISVNGNYSADEPAVDGNMCWVSVVAKGTVEVGYVVLGFLEADWPIGSDHEVYTWRYWVGDHNPIEKEDVKVVAYMPAEVPEPYIPEEG